MRGSKPGWTTWHITFGTYGTRLRGGERPSVSHREDRPGDPVIARDPELEAYDRRRLKGGAVFLSPQQQRFIQDLIPSLCDRGGWDLRTCSAGPDHVHILLDIDAQIHGERVRRIVKRWITQALDERWGKPHGGKWWAKQGSNKPVKNARYLRNAFDYIEGQRA